MEYLNQINSWPQALVVCVGIIGFVAIICGFFIALSGSNWPWEK